MTLRHWILLGSLGLTIAAAIWDPDQGGSVANKVTLPVSRSEVSQVSAPVTMQPSALTAPGESGALALAQLERPNMSVSDSNPFGVKSWYVPPPQPKQPVIAAPPPKPAAPALPFTYVGKFEDEGRWVVYLMKGEQLYVLKQGETFDNVYRFDGIKNGNLVIQYLPMSIKQLLRIGTDS